MTLKPRITKRQASFAEVQEAKQIAYQAQRRIWAILTGNPYNDRPAQVPLRIAEPA